MGKFNFKNEKDYVDVKRKAEILYKTFNEVYCPYFGVKIAFNSKGWKHLRFKGKHQARTKIDQYARLKLLYLIPLVISKSHTIQGILHTKKFESQKTNSRWERIIKDVIFYEFIAVLDNVRLKVIIKEVVGGEKYFWSVIPFWGIDKEFSKRILHSGNPEND